MNELKRIGILLSVMLLVGCTSKEEVQLSTDASQEITVAPSTQAEEHTTEKTKEEVTTEIPTEEVTEEPVKEIYVDLENFLEPDEESAEALFWRRIRGNNLIAWPNIIDVNEDGIYEVFHQFVGGDTSIVVGTLNIVVDQEEWWYQEPYVKSIYPGDSYLELYFDRDNGRYFVYCNALDIFKGELMGVHEGKYWIDANSVCEEATHIQRYEMTERSIQEWTAYLDDKKEKLTDCELVRTFILENIQWDVLESGRTYYSALFPVCIDGKYEYIDKEGNLVTNTHFDKAEFFEKGQAYVEWDGKCGYMDLSGRVSFEKDEWMRTTTLNYECEVGDYSEGLKFEGANCVTQSGKVVFVHEGVCGKYQGGMVPYMEDGKIGFLNRMGQEVIAPTYYDCDERGFRDGLALVATNAECSEWAYINKQGEVVFTF